MARPFSVRRWAGLSALRRGQVLATALGVDNTREAVGKAIETDPGAAVAAQNAQAEFAKASGEIAAASAQQGTAINETMRAELAAGVAWWHWRSLLGYVVIGQAMLFSYAVFKDLLANDYTGVNAAIALAAAYTPIFPRLLCSSWLCRQRLHPASHSGADRRAQALAARHGK